MDSKALTPEEFRQKWGFGLSVELRVEQVADLTALLATAREEALEEGERLVDDCTYECDCGKVYRDCDAKAHHVAAIRQARG